MEPPPAYEARHPPSPCGLSSALWLSIFYDLVDSRLPGEEQAAGRSALHASVRFVCRDFYLASMHILRSHHLSAYLKHVRPQYTTDPYPNSEVLSSSPLSSSSEAPPRQETGVLDLYIARATRDTAEMWESSLLSTTSDGLEDLFAHHQPRARLADLVVESGIRRRTIMPAAATREKWRGVVAEDVTVDLRSRAASLRLVTATPSPALRTIVEVTRERDEPLETTARHLAMALGRLTIAHHLGPHGRTYQVGR